MQGQEGTFTGHQWLDVDGDRDEDRDYRGAALCHGAARKVVVDDSAVGTGLRWEFRLSTSPAFRNLSLRGFISAWAPVFFLRESVS